jgi:hypothetical protein
MSEGSPARFSSVRSSRRLRRLASLNATPSDHAWRNCSPRRAVETSASCSGFPALHDPRIEVVDDAAHVEVLDGLGAAALALEAKLALGDVDC